MESKYDLNQDQTPYPYSWFSVDIKLGCLTIHLDEENWHKCVVSELQTNIQLMISMHLMDHGSTINYDIEEKQINLGLTLVLQELLNYTEDLNFCELESLRENLYDNHREFRSLFTHHSEEIKKRLDLLHQQSLT